VAQGRYTAFAFRGFQANQCGGLNSADRRRLPGPQSNYLAATLTPPRATAITDSVPENYASGRLLWQSVLLMLGCRLLFNGCRSQPGSVTPSVEFTRVPSAEPGRLDRLDIIPGRATGAQPGQQIVLYAKAGAWWLQPLSSMPFTKIQPEWLKIHRRTYGSYRNGKSRSR
jgi:hypothetical protein